MAIKKQKGFTLAELLVVIAVIGLLSSIVLVSLQGVREKARWARMLQFSSSLHHALGAELVGEWRFEEGINSTCPDGKDVCDSSGYGNNGTWQGTGTRWVDNDINELGTAGQFNGTDDYVEITSSFSLNNLIVNEKSLTIEAWTKPENINGCRSVVSKSIQYALYFGNGEVQMCINVALGIQCHSVNFQAEKGKWYHLVGIYNGTEMRIYVDGNEIGTPKTISGSGDIWEYNFPLSIGAYKISPAGNYVCFFSGSIDEVRIYAQGLSSAQIKKLYAEGMRERGLLAEE